MIFEPKEPTSPYIGVSSSIKILEDTPRNRQYAEGKNLDMEPPPGIAFMKTMSTGITQSVAGWSENYKHSRGDHGEDIYIDTLITFLGKGAVAFYGRGIGSFDGIIFGRDGYLYEFVVGYASAVGQGRKDFYGIISTIKFE